MLSEDQAGAQVIGKPHTLGNSKKTNRVNQRTGQENKPDRPNPYILSVISPNAEQLESVRCLCENIHVYSLYTAAIYQICLFIK